MTGRSGPFQPHTNFIKIIINMYVENFLLIINESKFKLVYTENKTKKVRKDEIKDHHRKINA